MSTVRRIASINSADKDLRSDNTEEYQENEVLDDETEGAFEDENKEDVTDKEAGSQDQSLNKEESDDGILPRFKGKTAAEISKAYAELEALNGRLSNEVGDYRKMARDFLFNGDTDKTKGNRKATKELTDEDFLEKPSDAVSSVVEEKLSPVMERLDKFDTNLRIAEFQRNNPDYMEIAASPEFNDWVKASPYRTGLYKRADAMDFDAASDLLQGFREVRASKANQEKAATKAIEKQKDLRKVSSEKSGSSGSSGKKKVWSSAYLINLKITNPDKYNSLQAEIMEAYREGRVK